MHKTKRDFDKCHKLNSCNACSMKLKSQPKNYDEYLTLLSNWKKKLDDNKKKINNNKK